MGDKCGRQVWETSVNSCAPRHPEWEIRVGEAIDLLVVVMVPVFLPVRIGIKAICSGGLVVPRSGRWIRFWSGI